MKAAFITLASAPSEPPPVAAETPYAKDFLSVLNAPPPKTETFGSAFLNTLHDSWQSMNPVWPALLLALICGLAATFWVLAQRREVEEADLAADTDIPSFSEIEARALAAGEPVDYPPSNSNYAAKPDPRLTHPEKLRNP